MEKKRGLKAFFGEFKTFITRGNVLDMAVGVIVGGAFTAIITALSDNILRPIINWILAAILGTDSLSNIYTFLVRNEVEGVLDLTTSIYIDWGAFISAIINFILIAFVLFCIVKAINKISDAGRKGEMAEKKARKEAVRKYRRQGMSREKAEAKYEEDLAAAKTAKEEEERLAAEKEAREKAEAEEKALANTRLLEEIRNSLKVIANKN